MTDIDVNAGPTASLATGPGLSQPQQGETWVHGPRLLSLLLSAGMAAVLYVASVVSPAARTIVGTWAPDPAACTPVAGMISIGPMSLTGDEMQCIFRDVARERDVVTWHGTCSDSVTHTATTVSAALRYGVLTVIMNGVPDGTYRRCTPAR